MFPAGAHIWKLSGGGDRSLGVSCTEEGLFLARTPLIERGEDGRFAVRPQSDLERLMGRAFGNGINLDQLMRGFRVVASALDEKNLCLAQIAAVQLRVPDLPDEIARRGIMIQLPGDAGYVAFRPISESKSPAVDINVSGVSFDKIHFP